MNHGVGLLQPFPGRTCGECTVCCVELEIHDPELTKADEVACPHMLAGGCGIYASRPGTCASWFCGWRLLNMGEGLRPDRSNVLMIPEMCHEPGYQKGGLKLVPVGGDPEVLLRDDVIDLAGRCIAGGAPIFLSYGSGARCKRVLLNPLAEPVVRAGDREGFLAIVRDTLGRLVAAAGQASSAAP